MELYTRLMKQGMSGPDVRQCKDWLFALKFYPNSVKAITHDKFGPDTLTAVKSYQSTRKLAVDGVIGPKTWAALESDIGLSGGGVVPPSPPPAPPLSSSLLDEFIAFLEEMVRIGSIYVWGGTGEMDPTITEDWIRRKETSGKNADRAINHWKKKVAAGFKKILRAFDCSGLFRYWLKLKKISSSGSSANGFMKQCVKIDKPQLKRGDFVFQVYKDDQKDENGKITKKKGDAYHIGYIVDNNLSTIESMGRDDGVVKTKFNASKWNAFGRPEKFFGK